MGSVHVKALTTHLRALPLHRVQDSSEFLKAFIQRFDVLSFAALGARLFEASCDQQMAQCHQGRVIEQGAGANVWHCICHVARVSKGAPSSVT